MLNINTKSSIIESQTLCVVILNFFGAEITKQCIQSLKGQPIDTLYLVDNSADEGEALLISRVVEQLSTIDLGFEITLIFNASNLGFSKAINQILIKDKNLGGHDFYLALNNDVMVEPNTIFLLLESITADAGLVMVSANVKTNDQSTCPMYYSALWGHSSLKNSQGMFAFLTGACLMFDAQLVNEKGVFDEDFFMYGEDVYLSWKLLQQGLKYQCVEECNVFHLGSESSGHNTFFYEYHINVSHLKLGNKLSRSYKEQLLYTMARYAYLSLRAILRSLRFKSYTPISAFLKAMGHNL